jgi:hypothetical protein
MVRAIDRVDIGGRRGKLLGIDLHPVFGIFGILHSSDERV